MKLIVSCFIKRSNFVFIIIITFILLIQYKLIYSLAIKSGNKNKSKNYSKSNKSNKQLLLEEMTLLPDTIPSIKKAELLVAENNNKSIKYLNNEASKNNKYSKYSSNINYSPYEKTFSKVSNNNDVIVLRSNNNGRLINEYEVLKNKDVFYPFSNHSNKYIPSTYYNNDKVNYLRGKKPYRPDIIINKDLFYYNLNKKLNSDYNNHNNKVYYKDPFPYNISYRIDNRSTKLNSYTKIDLDELYQKSNPRYKVSIIYNLYWI